MLEVMSEVDGACFTRSVKGITCEAVSNVWTSGAIGHFTVMDGSESGVDLVLIQTFLFYYVNQVVLMLTSIFQQFP